LKCSGAKRKSAGLPKGRSPRRFTGDSKGDKMYAKSGGALRVSEVGRLEIVKL
jgi:hypothetical protein